MTEQNDVLARAREFVGTEATRPVTARDPVNQPMIRRWAEAMGDQNPLWHDPASRAAAGFDRPVAPPAMLEVWTMAPYRPGGRTAEDSMAVLNLLDAAGYTGVVATNIEQEYLRYLEEGDVISSRAIISDVSDEKRTGLGIGHFVTMDYEFTDQKGELVGRMKFRVLKFKPPVAQAAAAPTDAAPKKFPHPRLSLIHI